MENQEWLKNITKLDLTVKDNLFSFMIPKFKELGLLEINLEEQSVKIVNTEAIFYPEDYEDLIIMLNDYNSDPEPVDCCTSCEKDYKQEFKDDYNHTINQLNYLQETVIQLTNQESDLKVGFLAGQLYSDIHQLKLKFWELETKLNNL